MKKFKGGLYADLSDYNTTLPNTEVLLNFFKSNPIGYRSGGMVRGIAGGNPTGMRVTGGFLANAQKFQGGDTVSAYYDKIPSEQYTGGFSESGKPRHTLENWRAGGKTGDNPWLHSDDSWKDWAGEFFVGHKDYVYTGLPEDATYKDYMFELQRVRQPNQYNSKSSFEKGRKENEAKILDDKLILDLATFEKDFRKLEGTTQVALAKSGVQTDSGTAANIKLSNLYEKELETQMMEYNTEIGKARKFEEANFARISGQMARMNARMQQIQIASSAGSSLLTMMG